MAAARRASSQARRTSRRRNWHQRRARRSKSQRVGDSSHTCPGRVHARGLPNPHGLPAAMTVDRIPEEPVTTTPALWQFLGAYLHQDWPIEFDDEWAALDRFIEESPE